VDPFEFDAQPTTAQLRLSVNTFLRLQYLFYRIAGWVIIACALVLGLLGDLLGALPFLLAGLCFAVGVPAITTWLVVRKVGREVNLPTRYRIDDEGIAMSNARADHLFRWPTITKLQNIDGLLVGRAGKAWAVAIPTGGLPLATASALTSFVLGKVPAGR
jgi:hypothetical protein